MLRGCCIAAQCQARADGTAARCRSIARSGRRRHGGRRAAAAVTHPHIILRGVCGQPRHEQLALLRTAACAHRFSGVAATTNHAMGSASSVLMTSTPCAPTFGYSRSTSDVGPLVLACGADTGAPSVLVANAGARFRHARTDVSMSTGGLVASLSAISALCPLAQNRQPCEAPMAPPVKPDVIRYVLIPVDPCVSTPPACAPRLATFQPKSFHWGVKRLRGSWALGWAQEPAHTRAAGGPAGREGGAEPLTRSLLDRSSADEMTPPLRGMPHACTDRRWRKIG